MAAPVADAGADQTIAFSALPTSSLQAGSGSGGSGVIVGFKWYILSGPPGHGATFDNDTLQNPTLLGLDRFGTWVLFLKVTDDLAAESTPVTQVLDAADSAFVHVHVQSQYDSIRIPGSGQRNAAPIAKELWDAHDVLRNDHDTHEIADHADTTATGAELETLTDGSNADALHVHAVAGLSVATEIANGVVKLAEAPQDALNPRAATRNRVDLNASVDGSMLSTGWSPATIEVQAPGDASEAHASWTIHEDFTIIEFHAQLLDGGEATGITTVKLYEMTPAQFVANDFAGATEKASIDLTQGATPQAPVLGTDTTILGGNVTAGNVLTVKVTAAPATLPGGGLNLQVYGELRW